MARKFPFTVGSATLSPGRLMRCLNLAFLPRTDYLCDREEQDTIGEDIINFFDKVSNWTEAMRAARAYNEKACGIAEEALQMAKKGESRSSAAAKVHELLGQEITWVDESSVICLKREFEQEGHTVGENTKLWLMELIGDMRKAKQVAEHSFPVGCCSLASLTLVFASEYEPTDTTYFIWQPNATGCPSLQMIIGDGNFGFHALAPRKDLPIMNRVCGFLRWGFGPLIKYTAITMTSDSIRLKWQDFEVEILRAWGGRRVVKALTACTKLARATWAKAKLAVHDEYWRREGKNFETDSPWGIALKKRYIEYWNEAAAEFSDLAAYDRLLPTDVGSSAASDLESSAAPDMRQSDAIEIHNSYFSANFLNSAEEWLKQKFPVQGLNEDGQLAVPRFHHPPFSPRVTPSDWASKVYERKWQDALHVRSASTSALESSLPKTSLKRKLT